jgi:hypothetical protein
MFLLLLIVGAVFILMTIRPHPPSDPIVIYVDRRDETAPFGCAPIVMAVLLVLIVLSLLPA